MGDNRARMLLRIIERTAYLPFLARLPAALGYRMACWRGDWHFRHQAGKRTEVARNLRLALGNELSVAAAQQLTREWFRLASCETVDVKRLRGRARPLRRLVEIRGREHLEAALAAGKGAILCTGHFGSCSSGFSVLHASGFPVTAIGRWWYKYEAAGLSSAERRLWDFYLKPLRRHRQRPNIEPWPGRPEVATLAAAALARQRGGDDLDRRAAAGQRPGPRRRGSLPRPPGRAAARGRDPRPGDRRAAAHGFPLPRGRLPPPGVGDLRTSAGGGRNDDGIPALRRRGERRHPEEPGPLGLLGEHGRSCRPRADPAAAGQLTSRGAGPSARRGIPARRISR